MPEPTDRYEKPGQGNDPQYASLREAFRDTFRDEHARDNPLTADPINIVQAPGRVNLIGEHVDYNEGIVFPMAIRPRITFAVQGRLDGRVRLVSEQYPDDEVTFNLDDEAPAEPAWSNYVRGPIKILNEGGGVLMGMDAYLMNSLPIGSGLSSSAAMEVGTTLAMLHLSGGTMDAIEVAKLCQRAENEVVGVPVGIMDMTAVAAAREGHAMRLDCRTMEIRHVPLDPAKLTVVICNSKVEHELTGGEYAERRGQCEAAAKGLGVGSLRDVSEQQVTAAQGKMDDTTFRRARHVVSEIARAEAFGEALEAGDFARAGQLMYESHDSLRDDYEVSTPELDFLVKTARGFDGVYGSRMTGAGFGGCTVTLCRPDAADAVCDALRERYKAKFGVDTDPFPTPAAAGARVVD